MSLMADRRHLVKEQLNTFINTASVPTHLGNDCPDCECHLLMNEKNVRPWPCSEPHKFICEYKGGDSRLTLFPNCLEVRLNFKRYYSQVQHVHLACTCCLEDALEWLRIPIIAFQARAAKVRNLDPIPQLKRQQIGPITCLPSQLMS